MNRRTKRLRTQKPAAIPVKTSVRVCCAERSTQKPATLTSDGCKNNNIILAKDSAFLFYGNIKLERANKRIVVVGILLR